MTSDKNTLYELYVNAGSGRDVRAVLGAVNFSDQQGQYVRPGALVTVQKASEVSKIPELTFSPRFVLTVDPRAYEASQREPTTVKAARVAAVDIGQTFRDWGFGVAVREVVERPDGRGRGNLSAGYSPMSF